MTIWANKEIQNRLRENFGGGFLLKSKTLMDSPIRLSIVMPCLNEAETLEVCIHKARQFLSQHQIQGEVVIADNGSTDGSQELACKAGARVVDVPEKGYSSALMGGITAAQNEYIIMRDADDSYDFTNLQSFVGRLEKQRGPLHTILPGPLCQFLHQ